MTNHICHVEIGCRDREKTADFYSKMFAWTIRNEPHGSHFKTGGDISGHISALGHEPHTYTIFYVMVDDVGAALAKAATLGGKKLVGPVPLPDGTSFGWFADPEGNIIGVYTEKPKA